jgi:3-methyladenine DNA glycosylase AlkD
MNQQIKRLAEQIDWTRESAVDDYTKLLVKDLLTQVEVLSAMQLTAQIIAQVIKQRYGL